MCFCGYKAHSVTSEQYLWGDMFWIPAKRKTPSCLWRVKQEEVELANMRYQRRPENAPTGMILQVQTTNSHISKGHWEPRVCFLWQGVRGVVLCFGDLLRGQTENSNMHSICTRLGSTTSICPLKQQKILHSLPRSSWGTWDVSEQSKWRALLPLDLYSREFSKASRIDLPTSASGIIQQPLTQSSSHLGDC